MTILSPNNRRSTNKIPEIKRLLLFMDAQGIKAADIAAKTGIAERTVSNFIWNNVPIGAQLLRELHLRYHLSLDWLLSGLGPMLLNETNEPPGVYNVPPCDNIRVQRMCALVQELMSSATDDEQTMLELHFKYSMSHYREMLSSIKDK